MKFLHQFKLDQEQVVKEKHSSKNKKGEDVTTVKKVKKSVDHTYVIKKPTRKLYDEAELFYGVKLSEGIKAGLLTRALLAKRFNNDGGVLSEGEKDKFAGLYMELFEKQAELQKLELKGKSRNKKENKRREALIIELNRSREEIQEFEMAQASLFDQTAENRARNKTILWWVTQLAHEEKSNNYEPVFGEGTYDERIAKYDEYEENEDPFFEELLKKLSYVVSFWYITKADTKEELDRLLANAAPDTYGTNVEPEPEVEPEPRVEAEPNIKEKESPQA